jgi:hypothetical protein
MSNQAVISGINDYKYSPYDRLRGCVEDAQQFNLLAQNYLGFEPGGVALLLDSHATAERIKGHVFTAVQQAKPGDHIFWTHSSHGTNEPDPSQADGLLELLCCYDTREKDGQWDQETVISARFIGEMVDLLHPKAHMDILIDACYAPEGSQLKAMGRCYNRARFLPRSMLEFTNKSITKPSNSRLPENVCLWSACESDQTSADAYIDGKWQGAFSAAFRKFFKVGRSRSDVTFYARRWLHENGFEQTCHLYGIDLAQKPLA